MRQRETLIEKTVDEKQFQDYLAGPGKPHIRAHDLIVERIEDPWKASHMLIFRHWMGKRIDPETAKVTKPPVVVPGLKIKPVREVRDWVLANAGARPADRDPVDARVVQQAGSRAGEILKSQEDVGGWPEVAENRRKLTVPDDPSGDDDGDG